MIIDDIEIDEIESLCCSAVKMSFEIKSKLIIVFTTRGRSNLLLIIL